MLVQQQLNRVMGSSPASEDFQERRSLEFFRVETIPRIAGFFGSSAWNLVLQSCEKEAAVRQAVLSLGALHDRSSISKNSDGNVPIDTSFPLRQYSKALTELRKYLSSTTEHNLDIILMCALIFISIEVMQNNYGNALVHLENSFLLLRQTLPRSQSTEASSPEASTPHALIRTSNVDADLTRAFLRLDLHASAFQGMRPPEFVNDHIQVIIPGRFSSITQSKDVLDVLNAQYYSLIRTIIEEYRFRLSPHRKEVDLPPEAVTQATKLKEAVDMWNERFQKYINRTTSKFSRQEQFVIDILLINHRILKIHASTCTTREESVFDQYDSEFDEIVSMASQVILFINSRSTHIWDFSIDMGVIQPLYSTATKCREPWIRQRAMHLLRSIKFQEGVWVPAYLAGMAQVAINREQLYFLGEPVEDQRPPEFARVHSVGSDRFDPVERTSMICLTQKLNGLDGPWTEYLELITW